MYIKDNPFGSETFVSTWTNRFSSTPQLKTFDFLKGVTFFKKGFLPLYVNTGRNHTKGMSYEVDTACPNTLGGAAAMIYDVPEYFEIPGAKAPKGIGAYCVRQYPGYYIDLSGVSDLDQYLQNQFSKSSRYKLKKYRKRLEASFNMEYVTYWGEMDRITYDEVFTAFRTLLEKRFEEKQIHNNNLEQDEWGFYYEVAYPLILEKKASLLVLYANGQPISVTLNYLSEKVVFDAITVFDIDYAKFHVGSITIMAQLEWCLNNGRQILDFSKGYFDYKERWATRKYFFEYRLYFNKRNALSRGLAWSVKAFLLFKQQLRAWGVNESLHRVRFWLQNRGGKKNGPPPAYQFIPGEPDIAPDGLTKLDPMQQADAALRLAVFDLLYLNQEHIDGVELYQHPEKQGAYLVKSKTRCGVFIPETPSGT